MIRIFGLTAILTFASNVSASEWEAVTADLLKMEKPGYGGLCGVAVDHNSGDVLVDLSDKGLYRSTDQGTSWKKLGPVIKGRTEWPGCLLLDPTANSQRAVLALVYGAPVGFSSDSGQTWSHANAKSSHVDWAVVDWTDPEHKFILALKHESGGMLIVSHDGGKSFTEVGKGYGPAWIFDKQTAVVAEMRSKDRPKPRLLRTTDAGKTWKPVGDYTATALPKWHDGKLYWIVNGALLATADQGKTFKKLSAVKDGQYGPIFGNTAQQLFILTRSGIVESTDGGSTWSKPIALPKQLKGWSPLTWMDFNPKHDVLYVMKMTSDLYRMKRDK